MQVTREQVEAVLKELLEGAVDRVLESIERHPDREFKLTDCVRWELIEIGENIDLAKLTEAMATDEYGPPEAEIAAYGRNREQCYVWARMTNADQHRSPNGMIPVGAHLRRYPDPSITGYDLFAPDYAPAYLPQPPADGSMSEVEMVD